MTNVNRELKEMAYARAMARVRHQLSPGMRLASRIIHQPAVNSVSETLDNTIGRPSGLIGAGLASFFGSIVYYLVVGSEYNFMVFLILLAAGFLAGLLIELAVNFLRK